MARFAVLAIFASVLVAAVSGAPIKRTTDAEKAAAAAAAACGSASAAVRRTTSAEKAAAAAASAAAACGAATATAAVATATADATATAAAAASTATAAASSSSAATQSAASFTALDYADFQISDGVAGNAEAEANAVFVDPFANVDLTTISSDVLDAINTMREAAESAETDDFDPQIDAASGADADALQVGKIKNKVLKLTGEVQDINIKIAQAQANGEDTSDLESSLAEEQKKLTTNIATDVASAGAASKGVV